MTNKEAIEDVLKYGDTVMTAGEIVREITMHHLSLDTGLSTVSSSLKKMVDAKVLLRVKGYGPRGGYGYLLNPNRKGARSPGGLAATIGRKRD